MKLGAALGAVASDLPVVVAGLTGRGNIWEWFAIFVIVGAAGAALGALTGRVLYTKPWYILLPVALLAGVIGFLLVISAWLIYSGNPWPAPAPYPGATPTVHSGPIGTWGGARTRTYEIAQPIHGVQAYFSEQMNCYCVDEWRFKPDTDCPDGATCLIADCKIRRWGYEQYFTVQLISGTPGRTKVIQVDSWRD